MSLELEIDEKLECYTFTKKEYVFKKNKFNTNEKHNIFAATSDYIKIIRFLKRKKLNFSEDSSGNIFILA